MTSLCTTSNFLIYPSTCYGHHGRQSHGGRGGRGEHGGQNGTGWERRGREGRGEERRGEDRTGQDRTKVTFKLDFLGNF